MDDAFDGIYPTIHHENIHTTLLLTIIYVGIFVYIAVIYQTRTPTLLPLFRHS
jgi:hypothetical protein